MGALDDAIREHLELKRKHGASPEEVDRQAAEAFGPARREPASLDPQPPLDEPALVDDAPPAPDAEIFEPEVEAELEPVPELDLGPEPGAVEPAAEEPTALLEPEPYLEPEPEQYLEPEPEPLDPAPPVRRGDTPPQGFPAVEPEPEPPETGALEPQVDEQDVLEETPDFLQDTPEHDRLWFEQKPPRDFDFDG